MIALLEFYKAVSVHDKHGRQGANKATHQYLSSLNDIEVAT